MALAYSSERKSQGFREFIYDAIVTFSGSYATGGETSGLLRKAPTTKAPTNVRFETKGGYMIEYDYENDKVIVRQEGAAGAPAVELSAAAYPAGLTSTVTRVHATYPKFG